ncbi:Protein NLRC5 [Acipenser ruthenus]|uniref:Protein NLRC5 n=1 Tax=Acipenser ruthenus TaxID=7906 RepID=A0A662YJU7_ACIRT|nr:Protein NLRC5 [Acipenser ruthenus]
MELEVKYTDNHFSWNQEARACQVYQNKLRSEAKRIIDEEKGKITSFLQKEEKPSDFKYIPVVLDTDDSEFYKSTKYKKARHKKIKAYIPCAERKLVIEDLLQSQEKNILLVGKPGIGKTTAAHQLMNLWIDTTYQGPKYMFYFSEETLDCISTPLSLKSLLFDFYCHPENPTDKDEVFDDIVQNSEDVFIILDGFSKPKFKSHINPSCTADLNISLLIYSIVEKKLLPDAKVLIACRPDTEHCVQAKWINYRVEVLGFSKESIADYFKTMLAGKENAISPDLFSLCHVPMYASIVACCILAGYSKSDSQSKTVTEMYLHIFRYSIDKHKEKDKVHHSEDLDKYIKDNRRELMSLAKTAFDGMLKKEENFADLSLDDSVQHCFLRSTSLPGTETTKKKYSAFLHNTMQEFFAALWLLENPSEINDIIQRGRTPDESHLRCMLSFFCGFLAKNNSKFLKNLFPESHINSISILPELIKTFVKDREEADILFACKCLYEAQSPDACLQFLKERDFNLYLNSQLDPYQCCAVAYVIKQVQGEKVHLNLQNFIASDTKCKLLLGCMENIDSSRINEMLTKKVARLLMSRRQKMPVTVEEITLDLSSTLRKPRRASVLMSNLAFILRHWTVSCLDLSACTIEGHSLVVLLCQQKHVTIKLSKESLQQLALAVHEAQEDTLAASFLEKVDHDLTSCNLTWEVLHFLLQQARQRVKVDWRKSKLQENNIKELIPLLHRIHTLRLSAAFCKRIVQEIVQRGDHELIFSFLEATDNCLNLNSSVLSFTDCEALRHFIAHSNNVRLDIHWTSISEDDIEKLLPVVGKLAQIWFVLCFSRNITFACNFKDVNHNKVFFIPLSMNSLDRHMLLRFLHAITRSGDPWAARSFLKAMQCKLNLSSSDAIDVTEEESSFCLNLEDCKAISTTLLLSDCESELILDDCEIQDDGLEWLFNVFQNVKLRTNKMILQRLLILTYGNDRSRGLSLSAATRNEIDLSNTPLNEDTCRALAHVVHSSEGVWELDLSNCGLSDQSIKQLQICLHRVQVLELFNNEIKNMQIFQTDSRYEI